MKTTFNKSDFTESNWSKLLSFCGIKNRNLSFHSNARIFYDAPIYLYDLKVAGTVKIGKYTYSRGGFLRGNIGSFCSLAPSARIGDGNHPLTWLSTSPAQYGDNFHFWAQKNSGIVTSLNLRDFTPEGAKPEIGSDVWIGANCIILQGVKIGHGAVVAAGSIVTKDVPPYAIVAGAPAQIKKYRFEENIRERLLRSEWWTLDDALLKSVTFNDVSTALAQIEAVAGNKRTKLSTSVLTRESLTYAYPSQREKEIMAHVNELRS